MSNQTQEKRKSTIRKLVLWGASLLLLICSLGIVLLWYLPLDPKSPPSTELGTISEFDALLENDNRNWLFVFSTDNQVVETDIYGENERVVLTSGHISDSSISPDGRFLAVSYSKGSLNIVDIKTGMVVDVSSSLEGYEFDWTTPAYWLSPKNFLVKMHRYLGSDSSSEDVFFLQYDIQDLESPKKIEIDHCGVTAVIKYDPNVLLLTSNCIPLSEITVWAIDVHGKRVASPEEVVYYDKCESEWWLGYSCKQNLLTESAISIRVESVVGNMVDGFGSWYDNNWYRDYVYLNDKLVRVSDGWIEEEAIWDANLNLLTWDEGYKTFQMDNQGHYRFWYDGKYIGKIPRSP